MTEPTTESAEPEQCGPLDLDFDAFAKAIVASRDGNSQLAQRPRVVIVDHTVRHLREESGLDDAQIAKVLLTASFVLTDMITSGLTWNAIATANWLGLCGERLWREACEQLPAPDKPEPEPPADGKSRWWAVWESDGRLREVVEFDEPRTFGEAGEQLLADPDAKFQPELFELMPLTESWAKRLRRLIEVGCV